MQTLDKYILREMLGPFTVGMGLFFAVVSFAQILKISDSVTGLGITGTEIITALIYSLPSLLGLLIPVSSLFATLLAIGRLASHHELMGLRANGISPYQLLRIPLAWGIIFSIIAAGSVLVGEPWGVRGLRELISRSAQQALVKGVRAREFHDWGTGVTLFAHGRTGKTLQKVIFADRHEINRPMVVSANTGMIEPGEKPHELVLSLQDGRILLSDHGQQADRVIRFQSGAYRLDVERVIGKKARHLTEAQAMSFSELWQGSQDLSLSANKRALLAVTLQRKFAIPLATLIFTLIAVPLASHGSQGTRARGILISTGAVAAYYYVGRAFELAARNGSFAPVFAAWFPNLLGLMILLCLLWRMRRYAHSCT